MRSRLFTIFALVSSFTFGACSHTPLAPPGFCQPRPDKVLCSDRTLTYPEASKLRCFRPEEIEPFLERCRQ